MGMHSLMTDNRVPVVTFSHPESEFELRPRHTIARAYVSPSGHRRLVFSGDTNSTQ